MKFEASNKTATFDKKPRIEKGYYAAKLLEVKPRQKEDGTPIESKFGGKQAILLFSIHDKKTFKPITVKTDNVEKDLVLPSVCNSTYKNDDGTERTAFTPNSRITKVFMALGWGGPGKEESIDTDKYVGQWVEVNIDDYEAEWTNEKQETEKYKASQLKDISKWEGETPSSSVDKAAEKAHEEQKPKNVTVQMKHEELKEEVIDEDGQLKPKDADESPEVKSVKERMELIQESYDEGQLTKNGYEKAMEQLKEELTKAEAGE